MAALDPSRLVAVIGSGALGAGIAQIAAAAGHPVMLFDVKPAGAVTAIGDIQKTFGKLAEKGRISASAADAAGARLTGANKLAALARAALGVEATVGVAGL